MLPTVLIFWLFSTSVPASYVPQSVACPTTPLVRPASGILHDEEAYRVARKAIADENLRAWLMETNPGFRTLELPTLALTTSGGGLRSLLSGGVVQGLDSRDSNVSTSGLYDALTNQSGLSGGSWMLSSLAGNNYPTITQLKENIWKMAFQDSLFDPSFLLGGIAYLDIATDIRGKAAAGFETTLTDPWGRLLSYTLLSGLDGGVSTTLSSVTELSNFTSHSVPFPIITALGAKAWKGECSPGLNATTYEFTPFDFGSWDSDVSAFTPTHYLGTSMKAGVPIGSCTTNYDNLGYILGTSSNHFNEICSNSLALGNSFGNLANRLATFIQKAATSGLYATYRNPFYQYASSTASPNIANNVSAQEHLGLVDGGEAFQNNPIFPLLVPARNVSVILVNDNSADARSFPNGSELLTTYVQSFNHGYTRMPLIPSVEAFISEGLNKRATFFGCNDQSKVTIVYLPNNNYTFASNTGTFQLEYPEWETDAMIANGVEITTQGGKAE